MGGDTSSSAASQPFEDLQRKVDEDAAVKDVLRDILSA